jgi:citrate synthase
MSSDTKLGLEGVVAAPSSICFIDGKAGVLAYRGIHIEELAEHSTFEETSYLLIRGALPTAEQLRGFSARLAAERAVDPRVWEIVRALPRGSAPMETLRTAFSATSGFDPDTDDGSPEANERKAIRITAQMATLVAGIERIRRDQAPLPPPSGLSHAASFLTMLNGQPPTREAERAMDVALIVHAEHEFNASTFAARVTAATLASFHAAITTALGTLAGPLHGGANQDVMELLLHMGRPESVEPTILGMLANKEKIPGFGHRVYKTMDPRATQLRRLSRELGLQAGQPQWYDMTERMEKIVKEAKGLNPNVDCFSASAYYVMGFPPDLFTPIFAVSRSAGWCAHCLEQYAHNRIIRPLADYQGPMDQPYTPIAERTAPQPARTAAPSGAPS